MGRLDLDVAHHADSFDAVYGPAASALAVLADDLDPAASPRLAEASALTSSCPSNASSSSALRSMILLTSSIAASTGVLADRGLHSNT